MTWVTGVVLVVVAAGLAGWLWVVSRRQQRIRAELTRVDGRLRALGIVHTLFEDATRQPRSRRLRSVKGLVPVALAAGAVRLLRVHPAAAAASGVAAVAAVSLAVSPVPHMAPDTPELRPPAAEAATTSTTVPVGNFLPATTVPPTTAPPTTTTTTAPDLEPVAEMPPPPTSTTSVPAASTTTTLLLPPVPVDTTIGCVLAEVEVLEVIDACL